MPNGFIVKALSGYYYVLPAESVTVSETIQCRARGIFKKDKRTPLVGDRVVYGLTENGEGTVDEILPRNSVLVRPPVANVRQAVLVFSIDEPALNLQLLDKFLVHIEHSGLETVICLTKNDLIGADDAGNHGAFGSADVAAVAACYESIGYPVIRTSAMQGTGVEEVRTKLEGTISVFSGQSGVGKSTLLNALMPELALNTAEISMRLGRGRHTTRHVEMIPLARGGWVADTPGFSQLDFLEVEAEELGPCFKEFAEYAENCKFRGCLHQSEPGCKVRAAVESGGIAASRYKHYILFLTEIKDRKRRY